MKWVIGILAFMALLWVVLSTVAGPALQIRLMQAQAGLVNAEAARLQQQAELETARAFRIMAETNQNQSGMLETIAIVAVGFAFLLALLAIVGLLLAIRNAQQRAPVEPVQQGVIFLERPAQKPLAPVQLWEGLDQTISHYEQRLQGVRYE